ncbi:MAG: methyltransferase domain-containing protein [Anaerolineales bacterium]|nr:methyltransferase domain-containing protein [Anaerolineales bacterium]
MDSSDKPEKFIEYYSGYDEQGRLAGGNIEFVRTQILIERHLPPAPAVVLDVGGAAGRYACWLAELGYEVHLVDPVPRHVEQARDASAAQPDAPIASVRLGDARQLAFDAEVADAVLLLGPLYHLTELADRQRALAEAYRVLKPGGVLFAAGISRFASTEDGLMSGFYRDPAFREIMLNDLEDGQHRNPTGNPAYFTDTFFHHPDELRAEVAGAGFEVAQPFAVEGIGYLMQDFETRWQVEADRTFLLEVIAKTEQEPSLIGISPHILCVGIK